MSDGSTDGGFAESWHATKRAISAVQSACLHAIGGVERWVQRRGRATQLVLGGVVTKVVHEVWTTVETGLPAIRELVPAITESRLLAAVVGVGLAQTILQLRQLNRIGRSLDTMSEARTDGGRTQSDSGDERHPALDEGTSGGGALGGAIAGAGLGSAYGPSGAVGGAIFGAIVGDIFEEYAMQV